MDFPGPLVGPLAGPECRRAMRRWWLNLARSLLAAAVFAVVLAVIWWWWFSAQTESDYRPFLALRLGLVTVLGMLVSVALIMAPAVLAGSLAGERERGVMALLLTTSIEPREIVVGRFLSKLCQVEMVLLATAPAVVLMASLSGFGPVGLLALLLVPAAVAWGGGGLATWLSVVSRRGRDALLTVYLIVLGFLLAPLAGPAGLPSGAAGLIGSLNPFVCLGELTWTGELGGAWSTALLWWSIGTVGIAVASWRLRSSCLATGVGTGAERRAGRARRVPAVDPSRPMLWKELFIERAGSLGRTGTWIGRVLASLLLSVSIVLGALVIWPSSRSGGPLAADRMRDALADWLEGSGPSLCFLIQWAVGLRAAVTVSSERERGTWDAILTSPLEPAEIVWSKLWGSLNALRWLIASVLLSWLIGVSVSALPFATAANWAAEMLVVGAFMAAVGVRSSLGSSTATRAMSITLGSWLVAYVAVTFIAALALTAVALVGNLLWLVLAQLGRAPTLTGFWLPARWSWPVARLLVYLLTTLVIVVDSRLRFDRLAGRFAGGRLSAALDLALHGRPTAPLAREASLATEDPSSATRPG